MSMSAILYQPNESGGEVPVFGNRSFVLRADATASASVTLPVTNYNHRSLVAYFNISSLPGSGSTTLALKIRSTNPVTGAFTTLLAGAARSASGTTIMMIGPGISASALGVASVVPRNLSFLISQSSGATSKDVTFSIGLDFTL